MRADPPAVADRPAIAFRSAADVAVRRTEWLWPGQLPAGAFVLLNGRQGDGKGTIGADWMARLTTGSPMPDGHRPDPINCAVLSLEDDTERTVVPRLKAAGCDLSRVSILDGIDDVDGDGVPIRRPWRMPGDLSALSEFISANEIRFLILDPVAYMIGGADGNAYSEVGSILTSLSKVAELTGCTIIGVRHLRKSSSSDARDAGIGSVAWTAVARVEFIVGRDPQDESGRLRVLAQSKNNLAPESPSFAYVIDQDDDYEVGRIRWLGASGLTARNLTAEVDGPEAQSDRVEARELLRVLLADGPVDAKAILRAANDAGIGERTLRKAKFDLKVKSEKAGLGGGWVWKMTEGCTQDDRPTHPLAALQPCSLQQEQDFYQPTNTSDPDGCYPARVRGDVQSWDGSPTPDDTMFLGDDL
ncbi:MAG: AAA family ATPase [Acidimicrobiales bacterium]